VKRLQHESAGRELGERTRFPRGLDDDSLRATGKRRNTDIVRIGKGKRPDSTVREQPRVLARGTVTVCLPPTSSSCTEDGTTGKRGTPQLTVVVQVLCLTAEELFTVQHDIQVFRLLPRPIRKGTSDNSAAIESPREGRRSNEARPFVQADVPSLRKETPDLLTNEREVPLRKGARGTG
jgi:hypothetical protein